MELAPATRLTIAISGARGFIGSRLAGVLAKSARVIGLTREATSITSDDLRGDRIEWRSCDLFSYEDAYRALEGVDVAYYLVHAMMPAARLTQARFEDLDVINADHFARAAKARGVKQIVYLGGLLPEGEPLSRHLASRREVEQVLSSHGVPVTVLRAGMVVGASGSSFRILFRLVQRLPLMISPRWMRMRTQPIDLEDVVQLLAYCAGRPETYDHVYDVGGPDVLSYEDMVTRTAQALGKRRVMIPFGGFSTRLSCLWVRLVTGAPRALVRPLIDSLNHETVARELTLQRMAELVPRPFAESLRRALASWVPDKPRAFSGTKKKAVRSEVRSVQRLRLPAGWGADRVAREYVAWLVHFFPIMRVRQDDIDLVSFHVGPLDIPLLRLEYVPSASSEEHALFRVIGGLLVRRDGRGRLEFLRVRGKPQVLAAVHDFGPRLPWWLYVLSQAQVHRLVMWAFGRHLRHIALSAPRSDLANPNLRA